MQNGVFLNLKISRYDPDFNHSPCLKSGHKAHWALVIGHLITESDEVSKICCIKF